MTFRRRHKEVKSAVALLEAQKHLQEVQSRTLDVAVTAAVTRNLRYDNHFAEQLSEIMTLNFRRRRR